LLGRFAIRTQARGLGWLAPAACLLVLAGACGAPGIAQGWTPNPNQRPDAVVSADVEIYAAAPMGWASVADLGLDTTTGGADAAPTTVGTVEEFTLAVSGTTPAVIILGASITGKVKVGSNKTIRGMPGVVFTGHLGLGGSVNVIVRDLTIVGNNCNDNPDCQRDPPTHQILGLTESDDAAQRDKQPQRGPPAAHNR
jgi:hypothetical protein